MSANVYQKASSKMQETVSKEPHKEAELNSRPLQQDGYASGDVSSVGDAESFSVMSGYYPYYIAPSDMNAAAMWSPGDSTVSPAAMSYGYHPMDYVSMMANYGYPGFGWHGGSGWEMGLEGMKNDPSTSYTTAGGYYGIETSAYNGTATTDSQEGNIDVGSLDRRMQTMNLGEDQQANDTTTDSTHTFNGFKSWPVAASHSPHSYLAKSRGLASQRMPWMPQNAWDGRYAGNVERQTYDTGLASRRRPMGSLSNSMGTGAEADSATGDSGRQSTGIQLSQYNPKEFDLSPKSARFFIIKSYAEDDIHRSIKYGIWCSTEYGNKRLDAAYREREGKGPVYLFFSVNGSGHFCGIARMTSPVDYETSAQVWQQGKKWKGQFTVEWIYVKDVPNSQLRHIKLENNEGKPVTNSRDTQEVPPEKGCQVLRVIHQYRNTTSIFDDFSHYEKSQLNKDDTC